MIVTMMMMRLKDEGQATEVKTNTDCLVKEQEKVHLGIKGDLFERNTNRSVENRCD